MADAVAPPEPEADPEPDPQLTDAPGLLRRARLGFRRFRRTRPFWGAVWTAWGGFVLLYLPLAPVHMILHVGIGGIYGMAAGMLLIALALLMLVLPSQRFATGIVAVAVGTASFPLSNLGGFFVGMFSAILGGVMAFGWMPQKPPRRRRLFRRIAPTAAPERSAA